MSGHSDNPTGDDADHVQSWAERVLNQAGHDDVAVPSATIASPVVADPTLSLPAVVVPDDPYEYRRAYQLQTDQTPQVAVETPPQQARPNTVAATPAVEPSGDVAASAQPIVAPASARSIDPEPIAPRSQPVVPEVQPSSPHQAPLSAHRTVPHAPLPGTVSGAAAAAPAAAYIAPAPVSYANESSVHEAAGSGPESSGIGRALREWTPVLFIAVVVALAIRLLVIQAYHIPSLSMAPTLDKGDRVIVNRLSGDIDRGEIVVFAKPPNQASEADDLIKRVIGLPGETVQLRDGNVYIDRQLVQESYIAEQQTSRPRQQAGIPGCDQDVPLADTCTVPEGHVFVMGDNRLGSQDSRVFGPVEIDTIVGRAFVRVWPLDRISWL